DEMFFVEKHRRLYRAMAALAETGVRIDPLTLADRLRRTVELEPAGGMDYIGFLLDAVPTSDNVRYHAGIVVDWFRRRALVAVLEESARELRAPGGVDTREVARMA